MDKLEFRDMSTRLDIALELITQAQEKLKAHEDEWFFDELETVRRKLTDTHYNMRCSYL